MLRERVSASDLESAHFARQLLERLGWAVNDAQDVEQPADAQDFDEPVDAQDVEHPADEQGFDRPVEEFAQR